jgi:uncharacterized YigZ family protein
LKYVQEEFSNTLEIKKSKFITHICPYSNFDKTMQRLKEEHPKGRHFVYAYRYLNEFGQIVENSSDDGEPKGTSGKPSLKVLSGAGLVNTAVIIVRYFGGIRLGTGGLVKAYSDAVNLVMESSILIEYEDLEQKSLEVSYNSLGQIEYLLENENINIKDKVFDSNVKLYLEATLERFESLSVKLPLGCELKDD